MELQQVLNLILPRGVAISSQAEGSYVLVADFSNSLIRKISLTYTPTAPPTHLPTPQPTLVPTGEPTSEPTGEPISEPTGEPTGVPTAQLTGVPTGEPTSEPTLVPSSAPSVPPITRFSFGVKIGDEGILSHGKAILVDYLQDARRGQTLSLPSLSPSSTLCHRLISLCCREDDSHLSCRQRLSRLLSFRPCVVIGFHSHQVASRDSSRDRILGQRRRQPHNHHDSWRRRCVGVLARESLE